jgi:hypothetical protein
MTEFPTYFSSKHALSMDLRDYFAAKALMATIETSHTYFEVGDTLEQDVLTVAQMAYMYADAMIKARNDS